MEFARVLSVRRISFGLAVGACALIAPATASAATQTIPGTGVGPQGHNLTIYVGDDGRLQAKAGAPGDSVQGMFFGSDSSPASNYWHLRLKGAPAPNTTFTSGDAEIVPVSNGPVTGNFTPSSPAQNVTVMDIVSGGQALFRVRQTVLYTAFNQRFRVVWDIRNTDPQNRTLPFIFGTSADLYIDSSDSGVGVFIDGPSRFVGGTNELSRTTGGLQEETASQLPGEATPTAVPRWASYQESRYSLATSRLETNDAFTNTIDPTVQDNGVGVSFDNRATPSNGLGPNQTQRYEVIWHAKRPTPLSASPASAAGEVPGQHQVTLSLVDANFNPLPGQRINYEITGANPSNGPLTGQTGTNGQLLVELERGRHRPRHADGLCGCRQRQRPRPRGAGRIGDDELARRQPRRRTTAGAAHPPRAQRPGSGPGAAEPEQSGGAELHLRAFGHLGGRVR